MFITTGVWGPVLGLRSKAYVCSSQLRWGAAPTRGSGEVGCSRLFGRERSWSLTSGLFSLELMLTTGPNCGCEYPLSGLRVMVERESRDFSLRTSERL